MLDRDDHGRIVWISSLAARSPDPDLTAYAISKGAQLYLTSWCAWRARHTTVTSTAVLPGLTVTEGAKDFLRGRYGPDHPDVWNQGMAEHPSNRRQQPASADEIASMVVYLTTPAASVMQGRAIVMDGGELSTLLC
jgi:NAD(P)-dependent dehydrogenase (short-subunit alcohol dehydrogenase family)